MSKPKVDMSDVVRYLKECEKDPVKKEQFNRSIKRAAERESKRPGGEITSMFMSAIRIP